MGARAQRNKSLNKLPPFVPLTWEVLNSKAYKELSPSAAKALPYFLGKYKGKYRDPYRYEYEFTLTYSEGKKYGFASATFSGIVQGLVRKGFIDPVDRGGLRGAGRSCSVYKLSKRWEAYDTADFIDINWKTFLPPENNFTFRTRNLQLQNQKCKYGGACNTFQKLNL